MLYEELTEQIIKSAFAVRNELGYGFLEKVYENALALELQANGIPSEQQKEISVHYRGSEVGKYYADILVDEKIILELKACERLIPEHCAQTLNYMKATDIRIGFLMNFGKYKLEFKRLIR